MTAPWPKWTPEQIARIGKPVSHGACKCGRQIVSWADPRDVRECGLERHSKDRCWREAE